MTAFADETFDRIKKLYAGTDVGPGAVYLGIKSLIELGAVNAAKAMCFELAEMYTAEGGFIEDGVTSNTDVFLEVWRIVFFQEPADWHLFDETNKKQWQYNVTTAATVLTASLKNLR